MDVIRRLSKLTGEAYEALNALKEADAEARKAPTHVAMAEAFCNRVILAMNALRAKVDEMETLTARDYWPIPTYGDLMFLP